MSKDARSLIELELDGLGYGEGDEGARIQLIKVILPAVQQLYPDAILRRRIMK